MKMKKMKNLTTVALISFFVVLSTLTITAQNNRGKRNLMNNEKPRMEQGNFIGQNIPDLTEKQENSIKELRTKFLKDTKNHKNTITELEAKLHTLKTADSPDMKEIYTQIEKIGDLKVKIEKAQADMEQNVRKLLTEDQKVLFDSNRRNMHRNNKMGQRGNSPRNSRR